MNVTEAIAVLKAAWRDDCALRDGIILQLVNAGIIEKPVIKLDLRSPCPALLDIKAAKISFFDNGKPSTYRGNETPLKREFGLTIHVWTDDDANVRSDAAANWKTSVPLWDREFALEHMAMLLKKKQVCQFTVDSLTKVIEDCGSECLYGIAFARGKKGSGWLKTHITAVRIEDRKPTSVVFAWGANGDGIAAEDFTDKSVSGAQMKNGAKPIHHARITWMEDHADWANDCRFAGGDAAL